MVCDWRTKQHNNTSSPENKKATAFLDQRKERSGRATVLLTKILNQINPNYEVDIRRVKVEEQLTRGICLVKFPNPWGKFITFFTHFTLIPLIHLGV